MPFDSSQVTNFADEVFDLINPLDEFFLVGGNFVVDSSSVIELALPED